MFCVAMNFFDADMMQFDADMMQKVWMPLNNRLENSLKVDPAFNFFAFIDSMFDCGAEFRANFARSGQSLRQLVVGGDRVAVIVPATMENQRVAPFLSFKNARK